MILRRVIAHVRKQEWTAIAIDLVIVVLGVVIGIQVSNWNAERGDRLAEAGYLGSLEEDVKSSIASLKDQIAMMERQQAARATLLDYANDADATLLPDERDRLVAHGLFYLPSLNISQVTFEALKSSGRLGAIRSEALVSELLAIGADIAAAQSRERDEIEVTYLFSDPILVGEFDMSGLFRQPNLHGEPPLPGLPEPRQPRVSPAVMKSVRFGNILSYRSYFTGERLVFLRKVLARYEEIAALIDARQAELGVAH